MEEADGKVNERFKEKEDEKQKLGEEEEEEEPDWMKNFADAKESKEAMNTFEKRMKKREETMKRIKPRAKGRADRILKRSCHITIKVAEK